MIPGGPDNIVVLSVVLYYSPSDAMLTFGDVVYTPDVMQCKQDR